MANFIQIGREIINLDLVARVERGDVPQGDPEVIVFYVGLYDGSVRTRWYRAVLV